MNYRADIDGLRAIAVILVILFHCNITLFSGGYVGVDVFFVISGYLITSLLIEDIRNKTFTFRGFYKRRAARLLPALSITLIAVLAFGFVFYPTAAYDNLGKQVFFSSFGAANILFAQGTNYFVQESHYQPLIHLWSLGVEEQFYVVWPLILLILCRFSNTALLTGITALGLASLLVSEKALATPGNASYFLPHYRAFELLIGAACAVLLKQSPNLLTKLQSDMLTSNLASLIGLAMIFIPAFLYSKTTPFPGLNALAPCVGTALLILFKPKGVFARALEHKASVFIGLISYPLYLYHQPVISFTQLFLPTIDETALLFFTLCASIPLAWITYIFLEKPIRRAAHKPKMHGKVIITVLIATIPSFAIAGLAIAKLGGLPERFALLNPFALEITRQQQATFHAHYSRGFQVEGGELKGKILFIGDSLLQQYVYPIQEALNLGTDDIDLVTRGGCVLLKGVEFKDKFADISCNDLREKLYEVKNNYEIVFISQAWGSYDKAVLNLPKDQGRIVRWGSFIEATVEHFEALGSKVVLIGPHPTTNGTEALQATVSISIEQYKKNLKNLTIDNMEELKADSIEFSKITPETAHTLLPKDIFCKNSSGRTECRTNNDTWSYFSDHQHISAVSTSFVADEIKQLKWFRQ